MTRRERMERRIERRREWAEGRTAKADGLDAQGAHLRHDWAFITQPGRIPERDRMNRRDERSHEHRQMAEHHAGKADGLERQLKSTIFSDDVDATEKLQEKIAKLDAERSRIRDVNAAWRKAKRPKADDLEGWGKVAKALGVDLETLEVARLNQARDFADRGPYPPYVLQNLGGRIKAAKDRITEIGRREKQQAAAEDAGGMAIVGEDFVNVRFAEKPEREVLASLRTAGFSWGGGCWMGYRNALPVDVLEAHGYSVKG